ncbi:MAG: hypothetical protein IPP87_22390 [Ideonella sp.]|nr:hypothetical protein [Ideonella sp.]
MYITDFTHFLDKSGAIGPVKGPARAMAQFHVDTVAHASDKTPEALPAPRCFKCKKGVVEAVGARQRHRVDLPNVPHRGSHFELAGQPLGPARPTADFALTRTAEPMRLSSKLFLLAADGTLYALANAAFMRMLRGEDVARVPDFAGQRVRQASIVVEVVDGTPLRMVHHTSSVLDIDADGLLNVDRLNSQQMARRDDWLERFSSPTDSGGPIVDAARRFVARGGSWSPTSACCAISRRPHMGRVSCPRVRIVR